MSFFWPHVEDSKSAHKACLGAAVMAFIISWLQIRGKVNIFPGSENMAYVDVGLFILIGVGLCFHSRIAALAGLLFYIYERILVIEAEGFQVMHVAGIVLFGLILTNGVRGAFSWHANKKKEKGAVPLEAKEEVVVEKPKKVFPTKTVFLLLVLFIVAGAAYYFLIQKGSMPNMASLKQKTNALTKQVIPKKVTRPLVAPDGVAIKLKLKSGRLFEGVLVKKSSQGYWIFIEGMGDVFFSVNEVAEAS